MTHDGAIDLKELDFLMFYSVRKSSRPNKLHFTEMKRYLNISFIQVSEDWNNYETGNMFKTEAFESIDCHMQDFVDGHLESEFIDQWDNFNIYCPNVKWNKL